MQDFWTIARMAPVLAIAMFFCVSDSGMAAEEASTHSFAEGDNPKIDERALQGRPKPAEQSGETAATETKAANWAGLTDIVTPLVKEYYPKAKFKSSPDKMHAEFKGKPFILSSTNKEETGPDWGGIVFDMELKPGPYAGVHQVPKKFNEYSFYSVELFAPYSKKFDRHLLTRICYPFDVPPEFLKRFKRVIEEFDQYL